MLIGSQLVIDKSLAVRISSYLVDNLAAQMLNDAVNSYENNPKFEFLYSTPYSELQTGKVRLCNSVSGHQQHGF